jgi:hypothetical protein
MSAATEINAQMDAELAWIVSETVSLQFRDAEKVQRRIICKAVGNVVGSVLIERLGDKAAKAEFTVEEFEKMAVDSISAMSDAILSKGSDHIGFYAAEACLVYAQARLMGLSSKYNPIPRRPYDDYWPFGLEGGFCNPMKLKMLNEDG